MQIFWIIIFLLGGYAVLYALNWIVGAGINKGLNAADNVVRKALDKADKREPEKLADRFAKPEEAGTADESGEEK